MARVSDLCIVLGIGVALVLAVGAPFIVDLVAGKSFHPAGAVLRIQGFALVASFVAAPWGYALLSLRAHRPIVIANLAGLVANGVLVAILASTSGARGAAIATVAAEALICVLYGVAVRAAGIRRLADLRVAARAVSAGLVAALPALLTGVPLSVRTLLCAGVYAALIATAVRGRRAPSGG
jgi:O-antigen/teichoic acid export membrane protein